MLLVLVRAVFVLVVAGFGVKTANIVRDASARQSLCAVRRDHAPGDRRRDR